MLFLIGCIAIVAAVIIASIAVSKRREPNTRSINPGGSWWM